jgi:cyanate permease
MPHRGWISVPGLSPIAHAVSHLRDLGHSAAAAGAALGLFSTSSIFGSLTVGLLCDRVEPRIVWAVCISLIEAGILVATRAQANAAMYLFTGMHGFGSGAALTCWHATIGNYFGPSSFPSILCAQLPVSNTIAAASPFLVGIVYDVRQLYASLCFARRVFGPDGDSPVFHPSAAAPLLAPELRISGLNQPLNYSGNPRCRYAE